MTRKSILLLLITAVLCAAPMTAFGWKFASFADSRGDTNGVNAAELTKIVGQINNEHVDLAIFQGDAVTGCSNVCFSSQFNNWLSIMGTLNCSWYYCPGNHEEDSDSANEGTMAADMAQPLNGPASDQEMAYSFDHLNAHFVGLNSNHYGLDHHVQRSWLVTDLASTIQPHIFVMCHEPAYPCGPHIGSSLDVYASERDDFWNMISNAGARMFFCGHEHLYQRTTHGNVMQIINGTCGAPLATGSGAISQYNYVVVTVSGGTVQCLAKNDTGGILDTWSYTVPIPTATDCDGAKLLTNTSYVQLTNKTVTCVRGTAIYVEEDGRYAAFRATGASGVNVGDKVDIVGYLQTNPSGEREIQAKVVPRSTGNALPKPLGMNGSALIGGPRGLNPGANAATGCNTSSLLGRVFGRVTSVGSGVYAGLFYIDDGSGITDGTSWNSKPNIGIRVQWAGTAIAGEYRVVTGICSAFKNGSSVNRLVYSTDPVGTLPLLAAH